MTNTYCCAYSVETPDDGQQICPKHVEFFIKINLRNSASRWLLSEEYITMHGPLNVKFGKHTFPRANFKADSHSPGQESISL